MKKILALCIALLLVFSLSACGGDNDGDNDNGADNSGAATASEYTFTYNGVEIKVGADAKPILSKLGNPEGEVGEACGTDEKDVIYSLSGVELETHVKGDDEVVRQIKIINDSKSTDKGITVGSSKDEVIKAYGKSYKEGSTGALRYEGTSSAIEFHFSSSGNVSSIYIKKK